MTRPAVIFDRDGTLIHDADYLSSPDGIVFFDDTACVLKNLIADGYLIIVITNQSGIARGYYKMSDAENVNKSINSLLREKGAQIHDFYICPHHPEYTGSCECRKPGTLLLKKAISDHNIDIKKSWFVGDKCSDIICGQREGLKTALVLTGYGRQQVDRCHPDIVCDHLTDFFERMRSYGKY